MRDDVAKQRQWVGALLGMTSIPADLSSRSRTRDREGRSRASRSGTSSGERGPPRDAKPSSSGSADDDPELEPHAAAAWSRRGPERGR